MRFFDYIYSNQVLEHVEDFDRLSSQVYRVIKKKSHIINLYPEHHI